MWISFFSLIRLVARYIKKSSSLICSGVSLYSFSMIVSIIKEDFAVNKSEPIDNADFDNLVTLEGILDFSEKNPFGEIGA